MAGFHEERFVCGGGRFREKATSIRRGVIWWRDVLPHVQDEKNLVRPQKPTRKDSGERTRLACKCQSDSDFRRLAETIFTEKSAIARKRSPARGTRALPRGKGNGFTTTLLRRNRLPIFRRE